MVNPDMFEHADRDDAVVCSSFLAIVAQMEAHAVGETGHGGPALRHLQLLLGER